MLKSGRKSCPSSLSVQKRWKFCSILYLMCCLCHTGVHLICVHVWCWLVEILCRRCARALCDQKIWLYMTKQNWLSYNIHLLYKEALPAKTRMRDGSLLVCWSATKINSSKYEQNSLVWNKLKTCMKLAYFFGAARTCILRRCITFHPKNLVYLRLYQHLQGAQVGSVCRIQLRPSDIVVSHDILWLFHWSPYWIRLKIGKYNFMTSHGKYDFITFVIDFIGMQSLFKNSFHNLAFWTQKKIWLLRL